MARDDEGAVVGAALVAHVPTIVLPEPVRRELNDGREISLVPGLHRQADSRWRCGCTQALTVVSMGVSDCTSSTLQLLLGKYISARLTTTVQDTSIPTFSAPPAHGEQARRYMGPVSQSARHD